jgi:hypothetical protein
VANNVARNVSKANLDGAGQEATPPGLYIYMCLEVFEVFEFVK